MPPKPRISRAQVLAMLRQGKKPAQIAKELGVSRQAINHHRRTMDVKTPLQVAQESIPWKNVDPEHKKSSVWARIVNHAEFLATGGRGMSERKLELLEAWYRNLEDLDVVVEYDPSEPPKPKARFGGWKYVPREDRDGSLLLRVNAHVEMTDAAYDLWRIPERRPEVA
ncbi:helix-turn-helix domain-containing protein [Amycolatopsis sp. NPDC059027]|uniref:helix-turn-helix domain-containing protein n=1 Tax=Amycolatopsis sp. NPDC059027 TaxID=3346709 RepID=UPI003671FD63